MKPADRFDSLIQYWAERAELPWEVVKAQVMAESSGDPRARSTAGAMGLLQLMPGTAAELGVRDPFNPDECLRGGTEYLAKIQASAKMLIGERSVSEKDLMRFALAAYNCGYGYVRRALRAILDRGMPVSWASFQTELPRAQIGKKRPRAEVVFLYVERILPL